LSDPVSKEDKRQAYLARLKGEAVPPSSDTPTAIPDSSAEKVDLQAISTGGAGGRISGFSGRIGTDTIKRIGEVVDEHPDKALAIFRAWMTQ